MSALHCDQKCKQNYLDKHCNVSQCWNKLISSTYVCAITYVRIPAIPPTLLPEYHDIRILSLATCISTHYAPWLLRKVWPAGSRLNWQGRSFSNSCYRVISRVRIQITSKANTVVVLDNSLLHSKHSQPDGSLCRFTWKPVHRDTRILSIAISTHYAASARFTMH